MKQVESFNPSIWCNVAISGERVIKIPTLYQIGTPINIHPKYLAILLGDENRSLNDPFSALLFFACSNIVVSIDFTLISNRKNPAIPAVMNAERHGRKSPASPAATAPNAPNVATKIVPYPVSRATYSHRLT